jgi:hypothetical protein
LSFREQRGILSPQFKAQHLRFLPMVEMTIQSSGCAQKR